MDGKAGVGRPNLKLTNMMQAGKERRLYGLKSAYETVWGCNYIACSIKSQNISEQ